jgi:hypothetical protein
MKQIMESISSPKPMISYSEEVEKQAICHAVPCNIGYTGPAPGVDVYFRPVPITNAATKPNDGMDENEPAPKYQAATIRGRGLLAKLGSSDGNCTKVRGHVFQVKACNPGSTHDSVTNRINTNDGIESELRCLQSILSFDQYTEWHHEHQTSVLEQSRIAVTPGSSSTTIKGTKLDRATEWMTVAESLHAPLPPI